MYNYKEIYNRASKYIKHKLSELKREIYNSTIIERLPYNFQ